jgi:SnoaL-like domain
LIQTAHNPVVTLDAGDRAHATTTIQERIRGIGGEVGDGLLGEADGELNVDQFGIYFDEVERIDGDWKFTHRLFVPFLIGSGTVVGDVVTARPLVAPRPA